MDAKETLALLYLAKRLFPRDKSLETTPQELTEIAKVWAEVLTDIPFSAAKSALVAQSATSSFPPTIKEIRDYATRLTGERRLTADEAWGIACEMLRTYGLNMVYKEGYVPAEEPPAKFGEPIKVAPNPKEYEAKRHCPKDVWEILEHLGYRDVYMSENPDVVRGQFMRAWSNHDKEEYEKRVIGGVLPQFLKDMNLLGNGQNGELRE